MFLFGVGLRDLQLLCIASIFQLMSVSISDSRCSCPVSVLGSVVFLSGVGVRDPDSAMFSPVLGRKIRVTSVWL